jgi:hypothetical protein
LVLIGLLVLLTVWIVSGSDTPGPDTSGPEPAAADTSAASARASDSLAPAAEPGVTGKVERVEATLPAVASSGATFAVRVVYAQDGSPAASAEVLLWPVGNSSRVPEREREAYRLANNDEQLDRWGRVFVCDAGGITRIPVLESGWFPVGARTKGFWGRTDVGVNELDNMTEIVVRLGTAIHLQVLVVDETRRPVPGVPVAYRPLRQGRGNDSGEAITGEDGIAHLRHLEEEYTRNASQEFEHVVALCDPAEPTVQAAIDPLAPPVEPIVLVLPATGSVEVEVFDLQGQPMEQLAIALQKQMSAEDRKDYASDRGMVNQKWLGLRWEPTRNGVARFERVGLGLTLEYGADFERTDRIESQTGPGPLRPGENVKFVLRQKAAAPVLTGRLVNEEGQPLPDLSLSGNVHQDGHDGSLARVRLQTGADGRFRVPVALDSGAAPHKFLLILEARPGVVRMAVKDLPAPITLGENELGDIVLGWPLIVAGVALAPNGEPAPTAYGSIGPVEEKNPSNPRSRSPFHSISWQADENGRFEVRGNLPARRYGAMAFSSNEESWRCDPVEFNTGAQDIELRFHRPPGVHGRILADAGVNLGEFSVMLMQDGGGEGTSPSSDSGEFTILIQKPGIYDFELRTFFGGNLLAARRSLSLVAGGSLDLGDIDLRGLPRTRIVLLDPDGKPIQRAHMAILDLTGWACRFSFPVTLPRTILHTTVHQAAYFEAAGFARIEVALNGGEQTVRLAPGFEITVALEGLPPKPTGWEWRMTLMQVDATRQDWILEPGFSTADFALPTTGGWMVFLGYRSSSTDYWRPLPGALGEPAPVIAVSPTRGRQEFRLTVNTEAVAQALGSESEVR